MSITLKSSFEEILGIDATVYTEDIRKERWDQWKAAAIKARKKHVVESWMDVTACHGCIHLDKQNAWCNLMGLPCTVNPILSFRMGMTGMACMGLHHEENNQLELFTE